MVTPKKALVDTIRIVEGRLLVDVALTQGYKTARGNTVLFSTKGNRNIGGGYIVGINVYVKE